MSVTSGFFNSLNHDRRYSAQQMSAIFDGIINDGVFANIGVAFAITADSGVTINIGVGKAWFNSAWVYNDALLPKTLEGSEVVLDRIDAVVIEVDHNESVRMGDIKIVKGTPSSSPKNPTMANETNKHQYPLAYIHRKAGSTEITQADITNMVGTSSCPYITGILQVQNIDNIVAQWNAQWNQWYAAKISETDTYASELLAEMKYEFDIWFTDVRALLDDDVATALAAQVAALQGKFDTLAREGAVYDTIEDSDLDVILGSDGTPIQGKTVFGASANIKDIDLSAYAKKEYLEKVEETLEKVEETLETVNASKLNRNEKFVRNLLDNSYFRDFIAQPGINTKHGSRLFVLDRWISWSQNIVVGDGYITTGSPIDQYIEPSKIDQTAIYTAAVGFTDGTVQIVSGNFTKGFGSKATGCLYCGSTSNGLPFVRMQTGFDICWVALYEGKYTSETLPEYQPKGYTAELLECQRYYIIPNKEPLGSGYINSAATMAYINIPLPIEMRVKPSITFGSLHVKYKETALSATAAEVYSSTYNGVTIRVNGSFDSANVMAAAFGSSIALSADL